MFNPTFKRAALGACVLACSWTASASTCSKDEAMKMYASINEYASELKIDAEKNPSTIPFRSGKNDPRLKKSQKISKQTASINKSSLSKKDYGTACSELEKVAATHKISLGGEKQASNVEKGMKGALQAKALKDQADSAKSKTDSKDSRKSSMKNAFKPGL